MSRPGYLDLPEPVLTEIREGADRHLRDRPRRPDPVVPETVVQAFLHPAGQQEKAA